MKRTTYILIALIILGIAAAFAYPLLYTMSQLRNPSPMKLTSGQTVTTSTPPFSRLEVKLTGNRQIYTNVLLDVFADSTLSAPQLTMTGGWSEWATISNNDSTLTIDINLPEIDGIEDENRIWSKTELPASLLIPPITPLHGISVSETDRSTLSLHNLTSETFDAKGFRYLQLDSCRITNLTNDVRYNWNGELTANASTLRRVDLLFDHAGNFTVDNTLLMRPAYPDSDIDLILGAQTLTGALTK